MTPRAILLGILFPCVCLAQEVRITEISPLTIGEEKEWFEFTVTAQEPVDLANWKISNGSTQKVFSDYVDRLTLHSGGVLNETMIFTPEEAPAFFSWTQSPLSLPNSGGTLQIVNERDEVLDEVMYPNTKSGTSGGVPYGEVWNRRTQTDQVFPLLYHSDGNPNFQHSRGEPNFLMPTFPDEIQLLINEFSPDGKFVELRVNQAPSTGANLKYLELKKKSSPRTVLLQLNDLNMETDELMTIDVPGLSGGSETFEILLYTGTSWETSEDFVCWQKGDVSQSVSDERDKKIAEGVWNGDCVNIEDLVESESRGRASGSDANTKEDFLRHYLGSKGVENTFPNQANQSPSAKFLVQGGAKIFETSLNLTGFDGTQLTSTDPNGSFDIVSYQWTVEGKTCGNYAEDFWEWRQTQIGERTCEEESSRSNPDRIYFNFKEKDSFIVSLTVTDYSGAIHTFTESLTKDPFNLGSGSAPSAFQSSLKKWIEKELTEKPRNSELSEDEGANDFFTDFLSTLDVTNLEPDYNDFSTFAPLIIDSELTPEEDFLFHKEKFSSDQQKKIEKNVGLIFLEPWCW